jgi:hypothetical protein
MDHRPRSLVLPSADNAGQIPHAQWSFEPRAEVRDDRLRVQAPVLKMREQS